MTQQKTPGALAGVPGALETCSSGSLNNSYSSAAGAPRQTDYALALAAAGFAVLPVRDDKTPATPHGFHDATRDPAAIRAMFSRPGAALVGIATGAPSLAAVLDIDPPAGLAWLAAHRSRLPATVEIVTRRGGRHLWFALAAGQTPPPSTAGRIAPGVDTRGAGGYCIAWYPGHLDRAAMAPWPHALSLKLAKPAPVLRAKFPTIPAGDTTARRYGLAALRSAVERVATAPEGARNETLNRQAFALARLAGASLTAEEIAHGLTVAATAAGLTAREAQATIRSALGARAGTP